MGLYLQLTLLAVFLGSGEGAWNVTCDLDLERIEEIIEYLPIECQTIYRSGAASELYMTSLDESRKFGEFQQKLEAYEREENSTPIGEVPKQNTAFRFEIYNTTMFNECANMTDSLVSDDETKTKDYYNCLLTKRDQIINLIPK